MNFTTDLPKKDPIVSYIVASAIKCEKFFPGCSKEGPAYRMHAVILIKKPIKNGAGDGSSIKGHGKTSNTSFGVSSHSGKHSGGSKWIPVQNAISYILCHVRKVNYKKNDDDSDGEESLKQEDELQNLESSSRASTP
jgi:hypothetical protein